MRARLSLSLSLSLLRVRVSKFLLLLFSALHPFTSGGPDRLIGVRLSRETRRRITMRLPSKGTMGHPELRGVTRAHYHGKSRMKWQTHPPAPPNEIV